MVRSPGRARNLWLVPSRLHIAHGSARGGGAGDDRKEDGKNFLPTYLTLRSLSRCPPIPTLYLSCMKTTENESAATGCFPFTKRFRKFRLGCKWNMIFRFVPLENFRKKWNFWKGSPVFPLEIFRWNCVSHLRVSQRFLPVPGRSWPYLR